MGGGSSTPQRVTLEDNEPSGVVKVSENVARRLMGQPEVARQQERPPPPQQQQPSWRPGAYENKEDQIQRMENYYKKRIHALEQKNTELYKTTTEQFATALDEVEQKFMNTTASPVCRESQDAVMKCYQNNGTRSLHCAAEVRAFMQCVQTQREKIITRKGG